MKIPRIVLTGGPCAGKTTAIAAMVTWAHEAGYLPMVVPEAATALMTAGLDPREQAFQVAVLHHVVENEALCDRYARQLRKVRPAVRPVLICDRGLWDQRAYMDELAFFALCHEEFDLNPHAAKGERYDGLIFLRSAAVGAPAFYSTASNEHRYESLREAADLDARTLEAWTGVTRSTVLTNVNCTFEEKIKRAVTVFAALVDKAPPKEFQRKFDVENFDLAYLPAHSVSGEIIQYYLMSDDGAEERVRARRYGDQWVYTHTTKRFVQPGVAIKRERIITRAEHDDLLVRVDRTRSPIRKDRHCFWYGNDQFELDVFKTGRLRGCALLEIKVASLTGEIHLPPFLQTGAERTVDPTASNYQMAEQE